MCDSFVARKSRIKGLADRGGSTMKAVATKVCRRTPGTNKKSNLPLLDRQTIGDMVRSRPKLMQPTADVGRSFLPRPRLASAMLCITNHRSKHGPLIGVQLQQESKYCTKVVRYRVPGSKSSSVSRPNFIVHRTGQ